MTTENDIWNVVADQFPMGRESLHGPKHWRRVLKIGRRLAAETGADPEVLELFAVFHDSRRENESIDHGHGSRGAALAQSMHGTLFELRREKLDILLKACREHTDGTLSDHPTVGTCWNADRLDLLRADIYPDERYLCTHIARKKEIIEWAVGLFRRE